MTAYRLLRAAQLVVADGQIALPFFHAPDAALDRLGGDAVAWDVIMKRMGVGLGEVAKPLGMGGHGVVFGLGDRALKLTDDSVEADAAFILKNNPMLEAYRVDDVFGVVVHGTWKGRATKQTTYCIVTELLSGPAQPYVQVANAWAGYSFGHTPLTLREVNRCFADKEYAALFSPECLAWLRRAAVGLTQRKILYADLKAENVMKRSSGEHCMIDFGHHSKVPHRKIPIQKS